MSNTLSTIHQIFYANSRSKEATQKLKLPVISRITAVDADDENADSNIQNEADIIDNLQIRRFRQACKAFNTPALSCIETSFLFGCSVLDISHVHLKTVRF